MPITLKVVPLGGHDQHKDMVRVWWQDREETKNGSYHSRYSEQ
jgi:hypothetical protein